MLDVLKFKTALFAGVLDMGDDQIFMGEDRFKQFMKSVEQMTDGGIQQPQHIIEDEYEEDTPPVQPAEGPSPADLFVKAGELFGTLSQRLSDKESTQTLVAFLIETDPASGKQFVKIPIANQEIIVQAVDAIGGLLKLFGKQQK